MRLSRASAAAVWLAAATALAAPSVSTDDQRRLARTLEPAPLEPPAGPGARVASVRIRFYADEDYRSGFFRWAERMRAQLSALNQFTEPAFGVRLEAESFRRWHAETHGWDMARMLAELAQHDAGDEVDWVVGLVAPLPLASTSMHELGMAQQLGRHFVLRSMGSVDEAKALGASLSELEPKEREDLYGRRKWHKEVVLFLHEWMHTLGAIHDSDPRRIMNPAYSNQMGTVSAEDAGLVTAGVQARMAARAGGNKGVDWTPVRTFLERTTSPQWSTSEREELLAILARSGARIAPVAPPRPRSDPGALGKPDTDVLDRAVALLADNKPEAAWTAARPLGPKYPASSDVQRLLCRLGGTRGAGDEGLAACKRARELLPESLDPLLEEAQARIIRKETQQAWALMEDAAARVQKRDSGREPLWLRLARLYGQIGALSRASEVIDKAAGGATVPAAEVESIRKALAHDRVTFGLPAGGKVNLAPERESAYADRYRAAAELLGAGKLSAARTAATAGLREFPGVPGLQVIACEIEMRQSRARAAEKLCQEALAAMPDLPRAHYLLGHVRMAGGKRDAAIGELRRSLELDPTESGTWETLAEVYRATGKRQELAQLKADYQKRFAKPLRQ
jgi:tetratricopeptide (TPR) repeat protein